MVGWWDGGTVGWWDSGMVGWWDGGTVGWWDGGMALFPSFHRPVWPMDNEKTWRGE